MLNHLSRAARAIFLSVGIALPVNSALAMPVTYDLDAVFLLDSSGSLSASDFDAAKDFAKSIIMELQPSATGPFVDINLFASGLFPLTPGNAYDPGVDTVAVLKAALDDADHTRGATWMRTAMEGAIATLSAQTPERQRLIFLVTDGNPRPTRTQRVCNSGTLLPGLLDANSIRTVVIGIGDDYTPSEIDCLVEDTDEDIIELDNFGELADLDLNTLGVTLVPLPAGLPLALAGIGALVLVRRARS